MELNSYFRIILKRWWAILIGLSVAAAATVVWTNRQVPVYESKATFVLRPRSSTLVLGDEFVKALDMVSRRVEINTTFAEVATSRLIKQQAIQALGFESSQTRGLTVSAGVVGGTNVLTITVEGASPSVVQQFCDTVGAETLNYVSELYDVFELQPLDPASLPSRPIRPNLGLNLLIGSFLGLVLGLGLALLVEFIRTPYVENDTFNIIDRETGAYNKSYFTLRLWQEMLRAKRNKYPLSLGLIKVEFDGEDFSNRERIEAMRVFKVLTENQVREDDILACIDGNTFAVLFPFMHNDKAKLFVTEMKNKYVSVARDVLSINGGTRIRSYSSVVTYQGGFIKEGSLLEKGMMALEDSDANLSIEG